MINYDVVVIMCLGKTMQRACKNNGNRELWGFKLFPFVLISSDENFINVLTYICYNIWSSRHRTWEKKTFLLSLFRPPKC